ncbi:hypothetical protein PFISCL1PPCAC_6819, partial [Pristionchus fissidentatus]
MRRTCCCDTLDADISYTTATAAALRHVALMATTLRIRSLTSHPRVVLEVGVDEFRKEQNAAHHDQRPSHPLTAPQPIRRCTVVGARPAIEH